MHEVPYYSYGHNHVPDSHGRRICILLRLEAVFKAERKGNILDIDYFRPLRA